MAKEPVHYSAGIADEILALIAEGKTLTTICKRDDMPSTRAVQGWVVANRDGFADRFRRARVAQAYVWVDENKDEADAIDNEAKARIYDARTRGLKVLIAVIAPGLMVEPTPPPQVYRITFDYGNAPPLPAAAAPSPAPAIEGECREIEEGAVDGC